MAALELFKNLAAGSLKTAKLQLRNGKLVKNRSRSGQTVLTLIFTEVLYYSRIHKKIYWSLAVKEAKIFYIRYMSIVKAGQKMGQKIGQGAV